MAGTFGFAMATYPTSLPQLVFAVPPGVHVLDLTQEAIAAQCGLRSVRQLQRLLAQPDQEETLPVYSA